MTMLRLEQPDRSWGALRQPEPPASRLPPQMEEIRPPDSKHSLPTKRAYQLPEQPEVWAELRAWAEQASPA